MVVQISKHTVCCDKILRFFIFSDDITLHFTELHSACRYKSGVIQNLMGICGIVHSGSGHIDFLPLCIGLIPEYSSPGLIQSIQCPVFPLQEFPESRCVALRIEDIHLAVDLIINLPPHNTGTLSVVFCRLLHNNGAELPIDRRIVIIMSPHPMPKRCPVQTAVQHLRVFLCQPDRRRSRWGAEYNLHPLLLGQIQK